VGYEICIFTIKTCKKNIDLQTLTFRLQALCAEKEKSR